MKFSKKCCLPFLCSRSAVQPQLESDVELVVKSVKSQVKSVLKSQISSDAGDSSAEISGDAGVEISGGEAIRPECRRKIVL